VKGAVVRLATRSVSPEPLSDASLIAACGTGDSAALGALFDRFHVKAFQFLSRCLGSNGPDVDDLVQATFLEVWRSASAYAGKSGASTWVLGIAANLARHHLRSRQRLQAASENLLRRPALRVPDVGESVERRELVRRVGLALNALSHDQKTAFLLCDVEGTKGSEVARALKIRPGTLRRRLHEARQALRSALQEGGR
jgi:RNA polymerase sigma-70 factor (ECF subfamily)